MKKLSAISDRPSAAPSARPGSAPRRLWTLLAIIAVLMLTMAASDTTTAARFNDLGHKMMCTCGCNQVLLECNHVGCTVSDTMRNEIAAGLQRGDNDDLILQSFVQKYGATVLSAPTTKGFNKVAWIMPFAVLFVATWFVVMFVRRWQARPVSVVDTPVSELRGVDVEALRRQAREETQI
jgi:cytochrome c-type biogenesis protein CcmH